MPLRVCWLWYTQNYVSRNLWHRNAFTVHTACDLGRVPHNFQCSSPFGKRLHQGAQIFRKCWSQLQIPGARWVTWTRFRTQNPQMVGRHPTKLNRTGLLAWCICAPLVSWEVSVLWCHISHSVLAASWTPSRYVVGLLLFTESHPRQPTGPSEPCVSGCFFLPAFHNCTSQQLAVQMFNFAEYSCRDHCSPGVPFGVHNCSC